MKRYSSSLASESTGTRYGARRGMVSHVEMAAGAGACTGAAGFKLFGKVITRREPMRACPGVAPPSKPQQAPPAFSSGRGSVEQLEEAAKARAAAAEARLPCPRCRSEDTKFCYFNNYNVNQPRHFCRACHRYWTAGGAIRNVPVGSGRRKNRPVPVPHAVTTASANDVYRSGSASPGLTLGFPPDHGWSHASPSRVYPGHGEMEQYHWWLVHAEQPPVGSDGAF